MPSSQQCAAIVFMRMRRRIERESDRVSKVFIKKGRLKKVKSKVRRSMYAARLRERM